MFCIHLDTQCTYSACLFQVRGLDLSGSECCKRVLIVNTLSPHRILAVSLGKSDPLILSPLHSAPGKGNPYSE
jgi:hypothetical protein